MGKAVSNDITDRKRYLFLFLSISNVIRNSLTSICLYVCLSVCLFSVFCLSVVCLSVCLSVCLFVCLSVFLIPLFIISFERRLVVNSLNIYFLLSPAGMAKWLARDEKSMLFDRKVASSWLPHAFSAHSSTCPSASASKYKIGTCLGASSVHQAPIALLCLLVLAKP